MDINIKKFSGRCDRIIGLERNFELFSFLNKVVKCKNGSNSIKLFPVKLKDFFTQEVLFMFVLRRSRDNFDTILPIFYSKTNSQVLRDLINLDFGDISLSMKDVYTIKSILSGTSSEQYNNIFTMYFSNDLGLHYDTFVGAKIVKLNSSDNETIVSNAPFLMSERHNLSYKDGSVNLEYMKNKLIESLGNDVNAENFDISRSATIVILASLASGLLSILNLKPMMIGVSGRLGYTFTKLANSFWSLPDSLELLKSKNLVGELLSLNGFTVSISENLYDNVSEFLSRGYGVSKLDRFHLTVFHFCEGNSTFKNTNFDELYLELDIDKKDEDIQNQVDSLYFQADDLRVQRIKADIDGFVDSRFGSYGCIGYEFLDFVYKEVNFKEKLYDLVMADSDFFQLYHNHSSKEVDFVLSNEVINFINDIYEDKGTDIFKSYDCSNMDFEMKNKYLLVLNIYCRFYMASAIKKECGERFNTSQKEFFDSFVDRYCPILMVAVLLFDKAHLWKVCLLAVKLFASSYEKIDKLYSQNLESDKMKILINDKKFVEIHNKFLDSISGDYNYEWTSKHTHQQYWIFSKEELTKCMDSIGVLDEKDIFTILKGWLELGIVKKNRNSPGIQLAVKRDSVIKKYYAILNTPIDNIATNNDNGEIDEQ